MAGIILTCFWLFNWAPDHTHMQGEKLWGSVSNWYDRCKEFREREKWRDQEEDLFMHRREDQKTRGEGRAWQVSGRRELALDWNSGVLEEVRHRQVQKWESMWTICAWRNGTELRGTHASWLPCTLWASWPLSTGCQFIWGHQEIRWQAFPPPPSVSTTELSEPRRIGHTLHWQ